MSVHKSLLSKGRFGGKRTVLKRGERVIKLMDDGRWQPEMSPYRLPKERVIIMKRRKKAEKEEKPAVAAPGTPGEPAAQTAATQTEKTSSKTSQ